MTGEIKIDQAKIREDLTLKAKSIEQATLTCESSEITC